LGARDTDRVAGKWQYWRPGAEWGIEAEGQWYELSLDGFGSDAQGKLGRVAWVRRLTPETSLMTEYSYGTFASPFRGVVSDLKRHRVQVSWTWRPAERP
jgi:hypothetical protein